MRWWESVHALQLEFREANLGGAAIDAEGTAYPLPLKLQREKQMRYCLEQWVVHSGTVSRQLSGPSGGCWRSGRIWIFSATFGQLLFPELAGASSLRGSEWRA